MGSSRKLGGRHGKALNGQQERFVVEYLVDLNATQAAIRAGYSAKTAYSQGQRLLKHVEVRAAVERGMRRTEAITGITRERVLVELEKLAFSDVTHYLVDDLGNLKLAAGAPEGAMRAISSVKKRIVTDDEGNSRYEVEFRLWDKPGTLKLAGQHVGLFVKAETDPVVATIQVFTGIAPPSPDEMVEVAPVNGTTTGAH